MGPVRQGKAVDKGQQHEQLRGVELPPPEGCCAQADASIQCRPPGSVHNWQLRPVRVPPPAGRCTRTTTRQAPPQRA